MSVINEGFSLRDSGCSNSVDLQQLPRHRWYSVKEAFSPRLVEQGLIDHQFDSDQIILEPFSGSGTVAVVGALHQKKVVAIEVNPFLAFVSETKLSTATARSFVSAQADVIHGLQKKAISPLERSSTFSPGAGKQKWLFNRDVLRAFEGGWQATIGMSPKVRSLHRLALIGATMECCNAHRDGKCLRYKANWENLKYSAEGVHQAYLSRTAAMAEDLEKCELPKDRSVVHNMDCRKALEFWDKGKIGLTVTSPPYLNSFDYSDIYRPELFLGKFVINNEELMSIRLRTLRSHIQAKWNEPTSNSFGLLYTRTMEEIAKRSKLLWSKRLQLMIQAYFEDIQSILMRMRRVVADNASLWMVVSTSAYVGIEIPVDLIIGQIANRSGWFLREIGVLRYMRTAGQHWKRWEAAGQEKPRLRESVVILDATPKVDRRYFHN